jgi:6,7-dimethyl-8-ribityllumazine synthase
MPPRKRNSKEPRIAFVEARWHADIVDQGRRAFIAHLCARGMTEESVDLFDVPGSLEIPLMAKRVAQTGKYAAVVGAGLVVDGGIYRHEFVAQAVLSGIVQVSLETGIPVISMVLSPHRFHEHDEHHRFFRDHFKVKGVEAASACVDMLESLAKVK